MKENISTIPITDGFNPKCGCPVCRLQEMLEQKSVDFILGDAMMQPDVRVQTNKLGFCGRHFSQMLTQGKRLTNALLLESHLQQIINEIIPDTVSGKPDKKMMKNLESQTGTCFVCDKIEWGMAHLCETIVRTWTKDDSFKELFAQQQFICLPHFYTLLKSAAVSKISGKEYAEFYAALNNVSGKYLHRAKKDITHFCSMFDYRSTGKDWGESKDSIERAIMFLTGDTSECSNNDK